MKIKLVILSGLFLFFSGLSAAPAPLDHPLFNEYELGTKIFLKLAKEKNKLSSLLELKGRLEGETRNDGQLLLRGGFYYNHSDILPDLKIGAFYTLENNQRTHDDWVGVNGIWSWRNTNSRYESSFLGDIHYKIGFSNLGLDNLLLTVRARYLHNFTLRHDDILLRPELGYFFRNTDGSIHSSIFLEYETWLALNYGDNPLWQTWYYISYHMHLSEAVQLGLTLAYRSIEWQTSADYRAKEPNLLYNVTHDSLVFGISAHLRFDLTN